MPLRDHGRRLGRTAVTDPGGRTPRHAKSSQGEDCGKDWSRSCYLCHAIAYDMNFAISARRFNWEKARILRVTSRDLEPWTKQQNGHVFIKASQSE